MVLHSGQVWRRDAAGTRRRGRPRYARITKRSHALCAPVQSSGFNVQGPEITKRSHAKERSERGAGEKGGKGVVFAKRTHSPCSPFTPARTEVRAPMRITKRSHFTKRSHWDRMAEPRMRDGFDTDENIGIRLLCAELGTYNVFTKRTHAFGAPVQGFGFNVQSSQIHETNPPSPPALTHPMGEERAERRVGGPRSLQRSVRRDGKLRNEAMRSARQFKVSSSKFKVVRILRNEANAFGAVQGFRFKSSTLCRNCETKPSS